MKSLESHLNEYLNTPFEMWPKSLALSAVSASANGIVNSGILKKSKKHFFRKWTKGFGSSKFVIEGSRDYATNPRRRKSKKHNPRRRYRRNAPGKLYSKFVSRAKYGMKTGKKRGRVERGKRTWFLAKQLSRTR